MKQGGVNVRDKKLLKKKPTYKIVLSWNYFKEMAEPRERIEKLRQMTPAQLLDTHKNSDGVLKAITEQIMEDRIISAVGVEGYAKIVESIPQRQNTLGYYSQYVVYPQQQDNLYVRHMYIASMYSLTKFGYPVQITMENRDFKVSLSTGYDEKQVFMFSIEPVNILYTNYDLGQFENMLGNALQGLGLPFEILQSGENDGDPIRGYVIYTTTIDLLENVVDFTIVLFYLIHVQGFTVKDSSGKYIATCVTCNEPAKFKEKENQEMTFCGKLCQKKFYN